MITRRFDIPRELVGRLAGLTVDVTRLADRRINRAYEPLKGRVEPTFDLERLDGLNYAENPLFWLAGRTDGVSPAQLCPAGAVDCFKLIFHIDKARKGDQI